MVHDLLPAYKVDFRFKGNYLQKIILKNKGKYEIVLRTYICTYCNPSIKYKSIYSAYFK